MNEPLITYDEMKAALERAVAERGEGFVYVPSDPNFGCVYREKDGTPACIVGLAMSYLRPSARLEERQASSALQYYAEVKAIGLADAVQRRQDNEIPWGEALSGGLVFVEEEFE